MENSISNIIYNAMVGTLFLIGIFGCDVSQEVLRPDSFSQDDHAIVIIVKQQSDSHSVNIANHLSQSFEYTKIPVTVHDTDLFGSDFFIPPSVRVICLTVSHVQSFSDKQMIRLVDFVAEGNTLFITNPLFDDRLNFLTGIRKDAEYQTVSKTAGFRFNEVVFPNYKKGKFKLRTPFNHSNLSKHIFKDEVEVIAESYDSLREPIITRHRTGQGKTIMFNSEIGYDKLYRGLLFSVILPALEGIPYPVANVSTIFLDDFPLPLYNQMRAPVDWEYNVTEEEFVANIWWPDMQALADTFGIDYTAVLAFNYNANVVPPFDFQEWEASEVSVEGMERTGSIGLAQSVAQSRHELGFHGYNHFSLWLNDWGNQEFMVSALRAARKRWQIDNLGSLPVTYVPPTNEIDSVGINALSIAIPNIKYLSSLYMGNLEDGGNREFGPDPYAPEIYNYPRISSAFVIDEENLYTLHSLYILTGIWTHFVHPDDIFQISQRKEDNFASRNVLGLGWHKSRDYDDGLYEAFKNHLDYMQQTYPHIRYHSAKDAVPIVKQWNELRLKRGENADFLHVSKLNNKNNTSWWFVYATSTNTAKLEEYINQYANTYYKTPFWNGTLIQFSSEQDSLALPNVWNQTPEENTAIRDRYFAYITVNEENEDSTQTAAGTWRDTRYEDALAELAESPDTVELQEKVIDLAIEFEQLPVAIDILEKRLMRNKKWRSEDVDRLLTYYGWEGAATRPYDFLEQLWEQHRNNTVVGLMESMVARYGVPDKSFTDQWLKRELSLEPHNKQLLKHLIVNNQTKEDWPQTKIYLNRLIELNPASDSLYVYTLQRSFYYDEPLETLSLLESFPEHATAQLKPLFPQIAETYAFAANDYSEALNWANRDDNFSIRRKLEWLLQQKRFNAFITQGDKALIHEDQNDSLRIFIGQQLIYNGFYDAGYARLYPLFTEGDVPSSTENLVHTEVGYQSYEQQKQSYKQYSTFYSDSLQNNLQHQYRLREGTKTGLSSDYASDNFDNTTARWGPFVEWGHRQKNIHRVATEQKLVGSQLGGKSLENLWHLSYQYQHRWPESNIHLTAGGGVFYGDEARPDILFSAGYGRDSTYTFAELTFQPEFTITALQQGIDELNFALYREDYFGKGKMQSTFSLSGKQYTNKVSAFEALGRFYYKLPLSALQYGFRTIAELSYSDASQTFVNGTPYFTPDRFFIQGIGGAYNYRGMLFNQNWEIGLELLAKNDNENGFYLTSSARLNARLAEYWDVSLIADISSSAVYRYNRVGITISSLLPRKL